VLLREIIESGRVQFVGKAEGWEEAVRLSCRPLIEDGTIESAYADEVVAAVREHGPYIVLMPGFALPHAMKNSVNAHGTAIAFMKLAEPVSFDPNNPEKDASVFFTLAAVDNDEHLKNMRKLWKMLTNEALCGELRTVQSKEELLARTRNILHDLNGKGRFFRNRSGYNLCLLPFQTGTTRVPLPSRGRAGTAEPL
jgi:PTS system ascorbate-specific IIA component